MKIIELVQTKLGITQTALGAFVGINRSHLNKAGLGNRVIPEIASVMLTNLFKLTQTLPAPKPPQPTAAELQEAVHAAERCRLQCQTLQKKLDTMVARYNAASNMLQLIGKKAFTGNTYTPRQQRWIEEQQYEATQKLQANGWAAQHALQHALDVLLHEIALYAKTTEGKA